MLTELVHRLSYLFRRGSFRRELDTELQFHMDARADELEAGGLTRAAALAQARRELGSPLHIEEDTRSAWQFGWLEDLATDLRYAARGLRRNPAFTLTAISCLALGIGANTTIFSVTSEMLFSRPSVLEPESLRMVRVWGRSHAPAGDYRFLRDANAVAGLAGENESQQANWRSGDATYRLYAVAVTDNFFAVTGTPLAMGRGIGPDEPDTAVVSWRFWQERLGADPAILGRKLVLDGRPHTVVGVLTPRHRTLFGLGASPDLYLPAAESTQVALYARLAPEVMTGEAAGRLGAAAQALAERQPRDYDQRAIPVRVNAIHGVGRLAGESMFLPLAAFFGMLMLVVTLVLLIACANVASLLLARAGSREHELAIRRAIGAGRGRLIRQLLAETLLLALAGAAAGLLLNLGAASWLGRFNLPLPFPIRIDIHPDWRLLFYAALVAVGASLAAGLAPALQGTRTGLSATLKGSGSKLRNTLVAGQIAVSIVLLAAGALFLRNLAEATGMNPGFDSEHTVWASMRLVPESYPAKENTAALIDTALERLRSMPGVEAAATLRVVPLNDEANIRTHVRADGKDQIVAEWYQNEVSPDYLRTMQIPLLTGRDFRRGDKGVVILNENFARRLFGATDPVGHTIQSEGFEGQVEIIGVARNSSYFSLADRDALSVYRPYVPEPARRSSVVHFMARGVGRPEPLVNAVRQTLDRLDPSSAIEARAMKNALTMALLPSRAGALVLGTVGFLGLGLASIGLYGVLLYTVSRRVREIGIRVALGATPGEILKLVLRHSVRLVGSGMAAGIALAILAVQPLAMFLIPDVHPGDPLNFLAVAGILGVVALFATAAPAIRALRIDPLKALRHE